MSPLKFKGIILAGGQSRRFGEDKALHSIQGRPMIQYALDCMSDLDPDPLVVINASQHYDDLNVKTAIDLLPNCGPLGGIYTASQLYPQDELLVLTCDMPGIGPKYLQQLKEAHEKGDQAITLYESNQDRFEPFPGVYYSSCEGRTSNRETCPAGISGANGNASRRQTAAENNGRS